MSDDELIEAMIKAFDGIADSGMWTWHATMRAVLAVVREHDKGDPTALANSGPKERKAAFDALKEELSDAQAAEREHDKDRERYRWLRENYASVGFGGRELLWDQPDQAGCLDAAVDAARAGGE